MSEEGEEREGRDDDVEEQRERYRELLEELRTIIPGVTVLLAFLLTVPFSSRFTELDGIGTALFVTSLTASTLSVVAFLAPAAYHRLTAHRRRTERIQVGVRATLIGMSLFSLSVVLALLVVVRLIYGNVVGGVVAGVACIAIVGLWFAFPVIREQSRN